MGTETPGASSENASTTPASDTAEALEAKMMKLVRQMIPGLVSKALEKAMPTMLEQIAGEAVQEGRTAQPEAKGGDDDKKLSMKALEARITDLSQQLAKRDEALQQERQRVIDAQARGDLRDALAGVLGADNASLPLVIDSLYDARKRVVHQDGVTMLKFKSEYGGDDEMVSLKDGIKRLTETELKHLIPSKTANLPATNRGRGSSVPAQNKPTNGAGVLDHLFDEVVSQAKASMSEDPHQK